jgi:formylglycine-generating enzyme required for sulfatase activity
MQYTTIVQRAMKAPLLTGLVMLLASAALAGFPSGPVKKCAADAVLAGSACMDKYEASVWRVPDPSGANKSLVKKIKDGKATQADLSAAGATQLGTASDDYVPCTDDGQTCVNDVYAVSLPGLLPSSYITWFQALEACANAGKRLPTSAEWQAAANGTPDPGPDNGTTDCNTFSTFAPAATASRSSCVSSVGAFDMAGNLFEWVADWVPQSTACPGWGAFSDDFMCLAGASTTSGPGALLRGGFYQDSVSAGPFSVNGVNPPSSSFAFVGFRCAR